MVHYLQPWSEIYNLGFEVVSPGAIRKSANDKKIQKWLTTFYNLYNLITPSARMITHARMHTRARICAHMCKVTEEVVKVVKGC